MRLSIWFSSLTDVHYLTRLLKRANPDISELHKSLFHVGMIVILQHQRAVLQGSVSSQLVVRPWIVT